MLLVPIAGNDRARPLLTWSLHYLFQELHGTGLYGPYSAIAFYCCGPDARGMGPWPLELPDDDPRGLASRWNFVFIEQIVNRLGDPAILVFAYNSACAQKIETLAAACVRTGRSAVPPREIAAALKRRSEATGNPKEHSLAGLLEISRLVGQCTPEDVRAIADQVLRERSRGDGAELFREALPARVAEAQAPAAGPIFTAFDDCEILPTKRVYPRQAVLTR
jgi:hypothetical protein